jgi:hypothetical protein
MVFEFKGYFARDSREGETLAYLKTEKGIPLRTALTLALTAFFHPLAVEHFGGTPEEVEKAKQTSRYILLNALKDMGGMESSSFMANSDIAHKTANAVTVPDDDDDFDDAFN